MSYDNWKTRPDDDPFEMPGEEPPDDPEPEELEIVTVYDPPAIPPRNYDWCAHRDGCEEHGPYGYGATREAAIQALLEAEAEGF